MYIQRGNADYTHIDSWILAFPGRKSTRHVRCPRNLRKSQSTLIPSMPSWAEQVSPKLHFSKFGGTCQRNSTYSEATRRWSIAEQLQWSHWRPGTEFSVAKLMHCKKYCNKSHWWIDIHLRYLWRNKVCCLYCYFYLLRTLPNISAAEVLFGCIVVCCCTVF